MFDFRGDEYINDYTYHVKTNINLPALDGISYLALRYRNSDWNTYWLTVAFDNISISDPTVGIEEEITGNKEIKIFPNPSTGMFSIQSNKTIQSIKVSDECGKTVYQSNTIKNDIAKIDLSNQPKGVYFINITQENKAITQKVIIQ